jgi:hypothetical protein
LGKSDLLQVAICRIDASYFINLHQVCAFNSGYQVLTSLIEQLAASLMNASMLMQVEKMQACCKLVSAGLLQVVQTICSKLLHG